jgi:septal ring factor EnvC (AmiA/AmiB activator)
MSAWIVRRLFQNTLTGLAISIFAVQLAHAQTLEPVDLAEKAMVQVSQAHALLDDADSARDRVSALTAVVNAYEGGLQAMRAGLRQIAWRQDEAQSALDGERLQVEHLLGALITIKPEVSPEALVHPAGPISRMRAGMLASAITPTLQARTDAVRVQLEEIEGLREIQETALSTLALGLKNVQVARKDLSRAIADRRPLPQRLVADPKRVQTLVESSDSLESFASSLAIIDTFDGVDPLPALGSEKGTWALPIQGPHTLPADTPVSTHSTRPGWNIAARPLSLVTSPWTATLRYKGALLDYGNVIILEPENDVLLILAGMDEIYGEIADIIPQGAAIGLMGGTSPELDDYLEQADLGTSADLSETLYIEIREGGQPADPAQWFAQDAKLHTAEQ